MVDHSGIKLGERRMETQEETELILESNEKLRDAYTQGDFASVPNGMTKYFRTSLLWQIWRFIGINFRMTLMILKSHH